VETETRTRLFEKELLKEVGRISSEFSHDIRGALQIVRNFVYLLEMDPHDTSLFPEINEAVTRITTLLDGFREYYKGIEVLRLDENINSVVEQALAEFEAPSNVRVNVSLDPKLSDAHIDPMKMKKLLHILFRTAVDAMPDGGNLTVETEEAEKEVVVKVTDTGEAIPNEVVDVIFRPFGSAARDGDGLSLATCWSIVVGHDGDISFESKEGEGTAFTVKLPKEKLD
jgi:signal transduction histidine kinase